MLNRLKQIFLWIKSHLIISFTVFFIIVFLLFKFLFPSSGQSPALTPPPVPSPYSSANLLQLINIKPAPPSFTSFLSNERIYFTFNQPLNPNTIQYQISPNAPSRLFFDPQKPETFSILPLEGWTASQPYQITINRSLFGSNKEILQNNITVTFTRLEPETFTVPHQGI